MEEPEFTAADARAMTLTPGIKQLNDFIIAIQYNAELGYNILYTGTRPSVMLWDVQTKLTERGFVLGIAYEGTDVEQITISW